MVPTRLASSQRYDPVVRLLSACFDVAFRLIGIKYANAIYVTNGDKSSPSTIHIYDATAKSWSAQAVTTGSFDPSSFNAILDHDTNVFCAFPLVP